MSILSDYVESYVDDTTLIALTNPRDGSLTTIDSARLLLACATVQDEFAEFVGAFDETEDRHLRIASEGVVAHLELLTDRASEHGLTAVSEYRDRLRALGLTTHRDYVSPTVNTSAPQPMPRRASRWVRPHQPR